MINEVSRIYNIRYTRQCSGMHECTIHTRVHNYKLLFIKRAKCPHFALNKTTNVKCKQVQWVSLKYIFM